MKLGKKQLAEIIELEQWFGAELARVKKKELDIMKRYDQRKSELLKKRILKKVDTY